MPETIVVPAVNLPPFDAALRLTLGFEGGVSDDPADRGGLTSSGVTQAVYDRYRERKLLVPRLVSRATQSEIREIYLREYWEPSKCDSLPRRIAIAVFDAAVNHGVGQASLFLQRALWTGDDGVIGPRTLTAAMDADERATVYAALTLRRDFYRVLVRGDATQARFLKGWNNRVTRLWETLYPTTPGTGTVIA